MKRISSRPRMGTGEMDGYKRLAAAVIVQALTDLPKSYRWVNKSPRGKVVQDYELGNTVARSKAIHFFKSGDYLFWIDVCAVDRDRVYAAFKLEVRKTIYRRGKDRAREEISEEGESE